MSDDIWVKVVGGDPHNAFRKGVVLYEKLLVQLDNMSVHEAQYYGGSQPYHRYNAFILGMYDIQQQDLLIDIYNTDSRTNAATQYRVINDPESFPDNHMELVVDRMVGT